jgi:hypothetical protein
MGRPAEVMARMKFMEDIDKAQAENARFLRLLRHNGLA